MVYGKKSMWDDTVQLCGDYNKPSIFRIPLKPTSNTLLGTITYPLPVGSFESMMFLFPFGGICDRSLEGPMKCHKGVLFFSVPQLVSPSS